MFGVGITGMTSIKNDTGLRLPFTALVCAHVSAGKRTSNNFVAKSTPLIKQGEGGASNDGFTSSTYILGR